MDYITFHVEMKDHVLHILNYYLKNTEDIGDINLSHLKYLLPCGGVQSPYLLSHICHFLAYIQLCTNSDERFHVPHIPDLCRKLSENVAKGLI